MQISVDADACPVKDIIVRLAKHRNIPVTMLIDTSHELNDGYSTVINVDKQADSVDFKLMSLLTADDIVVTQDYGLAAMVLGKVAYCLERMDWRMFKLTRLWGLSLSDETFTLREIPPEKRDFNSHFSDGFQLSALFDKSVKHHLIEAYGLDCYHETADGLYFEIGFDNRGYMVSWLLGFGDKVKVLEPTDMATEIQVIAKNILSRYL